MGTQDLAGALLFLVKRLYVKYVAYYYHYLGSWQKFATIGEIARQFTGITAGP